MYNQRIEIRDIQEFIRGITGDKPYRYRATEVQSSIIFHKLLDYLQGKKGTLAQESYNLWKDIDFQGFPYRMINLDAEDKSLYCQNHLTKVRLSILYLNIALSLFLVQKYPKIFEKLPEDSKNFYSKLVEKILYESYKNNPPLLSVRNVNRDYINFRGFSRGSPKLLVDVNQEWLLQILDCNTEEIFKKNYLYTGQSARDYSRLSEIPENERLALSSQYVNIPNNSSYKSLSSGFKTSFIVGFEFIDQVQYWFKQSEHFSEIDDNNFFDNFLEFVISPKLDPSQSMALGINPYNLNQNLNNMLNTEELGIPEIATEAVNKAIHQTKLSILSGSYSALRKEDVEPILEEQPCTSDVLRKPHTLSLKKHFREFVQPRQRHQEEVQNTTEAVYDNQFIVNFKHLLDMEIPNVNPDDIKWLSLYIIIKRGESWEALDYTEVSSEDDYFDSPRLIMMSESNSTLIGNIKSNRHVGFALDCFSDCIYAVLAIDVS